VVAVATRSRVRGENLRHRSVGIAVVASDGRLLVHRRSPHKDIWPGLWDVCVGGVVTSGETCDKAAARELAEELGIIGVELGYLGAARYEDDDVRLVAHLYRVVHDGPFHFVDGEIAEVVHVTPTELHALARRVEFVPDGWTTMLPLLDGFGS
jgi:8-oxo-dGTP pyrophosphatase MutT (NUDIX family)